MIRRPPRSTQGVSSAASDVYKRQGETMSQFILRVTQHANECDLNSMKLEDHLIMLAMIGTREEDLRSALYRLREPKWQEVKTVALDYERGRNTRVSNETAYYAARNQTKQKRGNFNAAPQKKKATMLSLRRLHTHVQRMQAAQIDNLQQMQQKGTFSKDLFRGKTKREVKVSHRIERNRRLGSTNSRGRSQCPVSYTHLTLPTIHLV